METAENMLSNVNAYLARDSLAKSFDVFCESNSLEDIFQKFWSDRKIRELVYLPKITIDILSKDNEKSETFRMEGNRLFKEKKFCQALMAYNYAVISACHPPSENEVSGDYPSLSFAFANRSSLLFQLKQFSSSLNDANNALKRGYPKGKAGKLEERITKCLSYLRNSENEGERSGKKGESETEKIENLVEDAFFRGPESPLFISKKMVRDKKDREVRDTTMSTAIKVQYSSTRGRHLVATRNINPGEILLSERAQCSFLKLNRTTLRQYCSVCLRSSPIAFPCSTCCLVVFCSETCQQNNSAHLLECRLLPTIISLHLHEEVVLVFKILSALSLESIDSSLKALVRDKGEPFLSYERSLASLYHLAGNLASRSSRCLQETAVYAMIVVQLLMKLWNFDRRNEGRNLTLIGGAIMRFILNTQCNIHTIKELGIDRKRNLISAQTSIVGYGIYSALSFINHSCAPNALDSTWANVKFLYSILPIAEGEEVLESYGERYVSHDLETRSSNLQETYFFRCACVACEENWPLFDSLPTKLFLKCLTCHRPLNPNNSCDNCNVQYLRGKKKNKVYDANNIQTRFRVALEEYEAVYQQLNCYKTSPSNIRIIGNLLSLLHRYAICPNKPYVEAQEALLRSYDLYGSQRFLNDYQ